MKRIRISYAAQRRLLGFTFLIPFLLGFLMFFALPLVNTVIYSFNHITVDEVGAMKLDPVGVQNYIDLFTVEVSTQSQQILRVLVDENTNVLVNMPLITLFSLFLALLANRKFRGRALVRMIFFLPIILGLEVVTDMLTVTTGSDWVAAGGGLFSQSLVARLLIRYTAIPATYLNPLIAFVESIFSIISRSGVQTLVFLAALQSISPSMYEVAKIELFLASQIAQEAYSFAFEKNKIGIGSALSVVYILNVLLVLGLVLLLTRKAVNKNGR